MSVADLHPEDLLDREARGSLTPKERAMLDAHLAHCAACRLERDVRVDFADEMAADSPVHDGSLIMSRVVSRVLEETEPPPPPEPLEEPAPIPALRPSVQARSRHRVRVAVLVAAALMLAGVAGAARVTGVWSLLAPESASTPLTTVPAAPPPAAPKDNAATVGAPSPRVATAAAPVPEPEPPVTASTSAIVRTAPAQTGAPILAASAAPRAPAAIVPVVALTPEPPRPPEPSGAAVLFSQANSARRQGEHARATALYRDLLDRHSDAAEASATRAALARLLLDDGDAAAALPLFETYLRSGDPALREEAMVGRARALERLGRPADERAAWSALLKGYPQSIHAARAHARLEELGHR